MKHYSKKNSLYFRLEKLEEEIEQLKYVIFDLQCIFCIFCKDVIKEDYPSSCESCDRKVCEYCLYKATLETEGVRYYKCECGYETCLGG